LDLPFLQRACSQALIGAAEVQWGVTTSLRDIIITIIITIAHGGEAEGISGQVSQEASSVES
jgi:hypothetical protein